MGLLSNLTNLFIGGNKKAPFAPNGEDLIKKQELSNRFNIRSPFGKRSFTKDKYGRTTLNIDETKFQEEIRKKREKLARDFLDSLSNGAQRFSKEKDQISQATFNEAIRRIKPIIDKNMRRQKISLQNSGIPVGSQARTDAMAELNTANSDLLTKVAISSILAGSKEQERLRRLSALEAGFAKSEIDPINQSFFSNNISPIDAAGIANRSYQNQLNRFNAEQRRQNKRRQNLLNLLIDK